MKSLFLILFVLLILQLAESNQDEVLVKKYLNKFANMNDGDKLIEVKLRRRKRNSYKFDIQRLWNADDDSMDVNKILKVNFGHEVEAGIEESFSKMSSNDEYLLALRQNAEGYYPTLEPISTQSHKGIWMNWCSASPTDCTLKISRAQFRPLITLEQSEMLLVPCRVSSSSPIQSIKWYKNDIDIAEDVVSSQIGLTVYKTDLEKGQSYLIMERASDLYSGLYTCVATNVAGDTVEMKSRVSLTGQDAGLYTQCPKGKESYCMHGGTCMGVLDVPRAVVCVCKEGFEGDRCHHTVHPYVDYSYNGKPDDTERLRNATTALSLVLMVTSMCLIAALFVLYRKRQSRSDYMKSSNGSEREKSLSSDPESGITTIENT